MLKFVSTTAEGLPEKRHQTQRACDVCRKRKKRCNHEVPLENPITNQPANVQTPANSTDSTNPLSSTLNASQSTPNSCVGPSPSTFTVPSTITVDTAEGEDEQFVGDLNPESIFLAATSPQTSMSTADENVGIWLPRRALDGIRNRLGRQPQTLSSLDPLMTNILIPYLLDQCFQTEPPSSDFDSLFNIFVREVHQIFPVINLEAFAALPSHSHSKVLLKQAICLAASTSPRAKPYLRLLTRASNQPILNSARTFSLQLSSVMRTSIDLGVVKDRLVMIQVLAVLSIFTQLSTDSHSLLAQFSHASQSAAPLPADSHMSAELTARTISLAQTIGLHLEDHSGRKNTEYSIRLFCCVWALDRLNAAFHGRPILIHEQDFVGKLPSYCSQQEGCFRIFLRVIRLLDEVIALYRPTADGIEKDWEGIFPTFEQLMQECGALRVPSYLLATIETLYHATAMLSCRTKPSAESFGGRQILAASGLVSVVGAEYCDQISYLPIVPYALSLCLRVFYREVRITKSPFSRLRARKQLLYVCELLRRFGDTFPSALMMVDLAEQTIKEMDKVYTTILQQQSSRQTSGVTDDQPGDSNARQQPSGNISGEQQQYVVNESTAPLIFDENAFEDLPPDLDVFDHFDAEFNLEAVDAALGDNINPSFPIQRNEFLHWTEG